MKMMLLWMLCCVGLVAAMDQDTNNHRQYQYCGRVLLRARRMLCMNSESPSDIIYSPLLNSLAPRDSFQQEHVMHTWHPNEIARQWTPPPLTQNSKDLIAKCCLKPCYLHELLSFC